MFWIWTISAHWHTLTARCGLECGLILRAGHTHFKIFGISFVCQILWKFRFPFGYFWTQRFFFFLPNNFGAPTDSKNPWRDPFKRNRKKSRIVCDPLWGLSDCRVYQEKFIFVLVIHVGTIVLAPNFQERRHCYFPNYPWSTEWKLPVREKKSNNAHWFNYYQISPSQWPRDTTFYSTFIFSLLILQSAMTTAACVM